VYQNLKALAVFDMRSSFKIGSWFGDSTDSHTQQWPSADLIEATKPWELKDLHIAEIEYYAPAKY